MWWHGAQPPNTDMIIECTTAMPLLTASAGDRSHLSLSQVYIDPILIGRILIKTKYGS